MSKGPTRGPAILEAGIQATCTQFLELEGWRSLRTDPVSRREWGKGFGEKGMADHLYIRYTYFGVYHASGLRSVAEVMWIEWKRLRGTKATKAKQHQKDWHRDERERGALTLIAGEDFPATIEGFMGWYESSGLQRRVSTRKTG